MAAPTLEELTIEGWRLGPYGPGLDPAVFNTFSAINAPDTSQQDLTQAFLAPPGGVPEVLTPRAPPAPPAPPRPAPLPEVVVTAGRTAGGALLGGLGALLVPLPTSAEGSPADFSPVFPAPLPEVTVTGQRPPKEPPASLVASTPAPDQFPTWLQPASWLQNARFALESAARFAARRLRRDLQGELADAFRPDRRTQPNRGTSDARRPAAPVGDRGVFASPVLDTVTVTARRPAPAPGWSTFAPGVLADPLFDIRFDPVGMPDLDPRPATRAAPAPRTDVVTRDAPLVGTPGDFGLPFLVPFIGTPTPGATPRDARPPPKLTPDPIDIFDPILTLDPFGEPPSAPPGNQADNCNCPKPRKRKPREPRTVCRKGTYMQTRKGIIYTPKETFQCQ